MTPSSPSLPPAAPVHLPTDFRIQAKITGAGLSTRIRIIFVLCTSDSTLEAFNPSNLPGDGTVYEDRRSAATWWAWSLDPLDANRLLRTVTSELVAASMAALARPEDRRKHVSKGLAHAVAAFLQLARGAW